jgi:hypothetical protein
MNSQTSKSMLNGINDHFNFTSALICQIHISWWNANNFLYIFVSGEEDLEWIHVKSFFRKLFNNYPQNSLKNYCFRRRLFFFFKINTKPRRLGISSSMWLLKSDIFKNAQIFETDYGRWRIWRGVCICSAAIRAGKS